MDFLSQFDHTVSFFWFQIFLVLLASALLGVFVRGLLKRLKNRSLETEWLQALLSALCVPSAWLVWIWGAFIAAEKFLGSFNILSSSEIMHQSKSLFFVAFAAWILLSWKEKYVAVLKERLQKISSKAQEEQLILVVSRLITTVVVIASFIAVLEIFGVQPAALLAFGGVGGVAIGFAAKDIVANFFGGFMIYANRHFAVGEWIMSPNKNFEGIVEKIGWYQTRIRSFARRPVFIPNALFIDAVIENPGRMYNRQIKERIGICYKDIAKIHAIVDAIRSYLQQNPSIDQSKLLLVHFVSFGSYSLDIEVYCFTKTTDWKTWRDIQQQVLLKIASIVASHQAEMAFPTSSVILEEREKAQPHSFEIAAEKFVVNHKLK